MNSLFQMTGLGVLFILSCIRPQELRSWYTETRIHTRTEKSTRAQPQLKIDRDGYVVLSVANTQGACFHYTQYPEKE